MRFEEFRDALLRIAPEKGCSAAEVFAQRSEDFNVKVLEQTIDSYSVSKTRGLSVRVCVDGRDGYAYTELLEEPEALVERAMDNARASETTDEHPMQGASVYPEVTVPENPLAKLSDAQRIEIPMQLERMAKESDERFRRVYGANVICSDGHIEIANTRGLRASRDLSASVSMLQAIYAQDGSEKSGGAYRCGKDVFDLEGIVKEAAEDAARQFGATAVPSGAYPILLEKHAASNLLESLFSMFSGDAAQKGLSLLGQRIGQQIAGECVSIVDDPLLEINPRPFDDEGVPSVRTQVVENGVLRTLLHNLKTAAKAGCVSTSNGGRSSAAAPVGVAPSNFFIVPGEKPFDQLVEEAGDGLLIIRELAGLHAGLDPISGDFSLLANGWLRENGKLRPVDQITVGGNFLTLLKDITAVGSDLYLGFPIGSVVGSPSLMIRQLMVAGS